MWAWMSTWSMGYEFLMIVWEGFPEILRTDWDVHVELPEDEMQVFIKVREVIGLAIDKNQERVFIPCNHLHIPEWVIKLYTRHGVSVKKSRIPTASWNSWGGLNPSTGERKKGEGWGGSIECYVIIWWQESSHAATFVRKGVEDLIKERPAIDLPSVDDIYYVTFAGRHSVPQSIALSFRASDQTWHSSSSIRAQWIGRRIWNDSIIIDISPATDDQKKYF